MKEELSGVVEKQELRLRKRESRGMWTGEGCDPQWILRKVSADNRGFMVQSVIILLCLGILRESVKRRKQHTGCLAAMLT